MTKTHRSVVSAAISAAVFAAAGSALAVDSYVATPVPPLPGGFTTLAHGVNDSGVVVGQADNMNGELAAFVFQGGVTTELPFLTGGSDAQAWSINNSNVIVGECRDASSTSRPVKWELVSGTWQVTDLGTLDVNNGGFGVATRINNAGQIVGYSTKVNPGAYHATLWSGGDKTDLGTLHFVGNFAYSQALGIGENGEITGFAYATLQGPEHGMLVTGRGAQDVTQAGQFSLAQWHNVNSSGILGGYISSSQTSGEFRPATYDRTSGDNNGFTIVPLIPGLQGGYGYDIDDTGRLIGVMFYLDPDPSLSIFKAFVSLNGTTSDLNDLTTGLPGVMTEAADISGNGHIVGTADGEFGSVAVLLTPGVPCEADFNHDQDVSVQDIFDFLAAYFGGEGSADVNHDRSVSVQDIFDYLALYFAGCD